MFEAARVNRRRTRRCNIMWPATIDEGGRDRTCTITDLSERGARLELPSPVRPHSRVKLLCERFGELHGVVVWCKGTAAGIRFNLPAADIARLLTPLVPGMGRRHPAPPALPVPAMDYGERHGFGRKARAA